MGLELQLYCDMIAFGVVGRIDFGINLSNASEHCFHRRQQLLL